MGLSIDLQRLNFGYEYSQPNNDLRYVGSQGTWAASNGLWSWSSTNRTMIIHTISMCPRPYNQSDIGPPNAIEAANATSSTSTGTILTTRLSVYLSTTSSVQANTNGACVARQAGLYYQHCVLIDKKTPLIVPANTYLLLEAKGGATLSNDIDFDYYITMLEVKS